MFFAKAEFVPDAEVAEEAQRAAHEAVRMGEEQYDIHLDGTVESIRGLDEILEHIHDSVSAFEDPRAETTRFAHVFGSYFGEVLRQAHGAIWGFTLIHYKRGVPTQQIGPNYIVILPEHLVSERIEKGSQKSLWTYYETLAQVLLAVEERMASGVRPVQKDRLYTIQHHEGYIDCGICADGRQVLADPFNRTGSAVIFFDSAGNLLGCEVRPFPEEVPHGTSGFVAAVERAWKAWMDEIGYKPGTIHVRTFVAAEQGIGIEDRPDHFEAFLKAPELEAPDPEDRRWMFDQIREWDEEGTYVLYYGNDLWMDEDGDINST